MLRNILAQAPQCVDAALAMLTDERLIARSLVLPFRYLTALEALENSQLPRAGAAIAALGDAVDKALANVPRFDMQGWMGHDAPVASFKAYRDRTGADPKVFSFDLNGYGTLQFPERNIYCLAGFSDKTLQTMKFLEEDQHALMREIEAIAL